MDRTQAAWLAGLFEGEGCLTFTGKNSVSLTINMTDEDVVRRCHELTGMGAVRGPYRVGIPRLKPMWSWGVSHQDDLRVLLPKLLPWLGTRRRERAKDALARLRVIKRVGQCKLGHPMEGDNLYVSPRGQRQCRTCLRARDRRRHVIKY